MSAGNGDKADDGTVLVVPITAHYQLQATLEDVAGKLADAERRVAVLERQLAELREGIRVTAPDSPLAKREALRAQLAELRRLR